MKKKTKVKFKDVFKTMIKEDPKGAAAVVGSVVVIALGIIGDISLIQLIIRENKEI